MPRNKINSKLFYKSMFLEKEILSGNEDKLNLKLNVYKFTCTVNPRSLFMMNIVTITLF